MWIYHIGHDALWTNGQKYVWDAELPTIGIQKEIRMKRLILVAMLVPTIVFSDRESDLLRANLKMLSDADQNKLADVEAAIEAGANVNFHGELGYTALILASDRGHEEIVKFLIKSKAKVDARRDNGMTALMYAAWLGRTNVVKLLIEAKASVHVKDKYSNTALKLATEKGHAEIVKLLKEAGAR